MQYLYEFRSVPKKYFSFLFLSELLPLFSHTLSFAEKNDAFNQRNLCRLAFNARIMSKDERTIVQNSNYFHTVASNILKSTTCFHVSKKRIDKLNKMLNSWDNTAQDQGISEVCGEYQLDSKTIKCLQI